MVGVMVCSVFFGVYTTHAQTGSVETGQQSGQIFPNPAKGNGTICTFLVMLLNLITEIGAIIGVLAIIACGFMFIVAQGNEDRLKKVKTAFLWTVLGVLLLLGASVIGHILITTVNAVLTAGGNNLPNQSDLTCTQ